MWISLMGIFNHDSTIFDKFNLPKKVDKNVLINQLLLQSAEREILYADPNLLKDYIGCWSAARVDVWEHLFATTEYDYNPIENYDRNEVWSDTEKNADKNSQSARDNYFGHGQDKGVIQTDREEDDYQTAFNTTDLWQTGQRRVINYERPDISFTRDGNSTSSADVTSDRSKNATHSGRVHGNIGTMTTQSMIQQERDIAEFNIYDRICDDFMREFCLGIY